ncbi:MAG: ATP-binding protein [Bacteroidota bacterium]
MNIHIKQLSLINFKGIKELSIEFNSVTNISGENGTGKSTIFDAFTWLLFGKDSHDSKDFNIKTLDQVGKAIPMLEHGVEGILDIDGTEITLKRIYQEKWQRRRGSEESELTGHETLCYWNGVPQQAGEFKTKVDALVNEGLFKLLTSALYFNSMKWQDRRLVLILLAGEISNADVLAKMNKQQVAEITAILNSGKPLTDFLKELSMRKRKLSDDLKTIPSRIDEVTRAIPEPVDFEAVKSDICKKQAALAEIENTINDQVAAYKSQGDAIQTVQNEIFELKKQQQSMEFEAKTEAQRIYNERAFLIAGLKQKHAECLLRSKSNQDSLPKLLQKKTETEKAMLELRNQWKTINDKEYLFKEEDNFCPTCKQPLDPSAMADSEINPKLIFELWKSNRLSDITNEGQKLSVVLAQTNKNIEVTNNEISALVIEADELTAQLKSAMSTELQYVIAQDTEPVQDHITRLELQILESPKLDIESLKQHKSNVLSEINRLQTIMGAEEVIKRGKARINYLMGEEKTLSQQISDLEKQEFAMDAYTRCRMDTVESRINGKFNVVRFRMFNMLINAGIEEACDCLVGGVPYNDVNSAGKIQAGIDIINTLSKHYGISAPIWIDNRESTNKIPSTTSQVINLIVSTDKTLIIK